NRFFFSSARDAASGDYTFLSGQTGAGEASVDIPPPSRPGTNVAPTAPTDPNRKATFQISGLTGTLKSDNAQAVFSLCVDPQYPVPAKPTDPAPQTAYIRVQITYQDGPTSAGGTGMTVKQLYDGFNLSNNPGYVNGVSVQNGAGIGNPDTGGGVQPLLSKLTNATVTVEIWARDATSPRAPAGDPKGNPIPIRLGTAAVGEQGRVSSLALPYNFTQIGGQSAGDLKLAPPPIVSVVEAAPREVLPGDSVSD